MTSGEYDELEEQIAHEMERDELLKKLEAEKGAHSKLETAAWKLIDAFVAVKKKGTCMDDMDTAALEEFQRFVEDNYTREQKLENENE